MLEKYLPLLIVILLAIIVGFIVVILASFSDPAVQTGKRAPYESGMVPYGPGKRRVSVRYYLIAVLFILFDIEVVFLVPWSVVIREIGDAGCDIHDHFCADIRGSAFICLEERSTGMGIEQKAGDLGL